MHSRDFIKNSAQQIAGKTAKKAKKSRKFGGAAGDMPSTPSNNRRRASVKGEKSRGGRSDFA